MSPTNNGNPAATDDKGADACIPIDAWGTLPRNWWNNIESYRWVTSLECERAGIIPLGTGYE